MKQKLVKCHSEHMQLYPNKIKVTVTFGADQMYLVHHMAKRMTTTGCLAEMVKDIFWDGFKTLWQEMQAEEANKNAQPIDLSVLGVAK